MPAAAAVPVAVAAAGALAQLYQSEKARKASAERLAEIKAAFDALVPPKYNLTPMDPPKFITSKVKEPDIDYSKMTPEQFKLVGKYSPQLAPHIAEKNPKLVEDTAASREGRDAQLSALRKLRQVASSDQDPELQQQLDEASKRAQVDAQSRQQSVLQDAARRGSMDSGTALAASLQGGSDAMERSAMESSNAAVAAYKNRLSALRDSASLGGQVRGDEMEMESRNANIINDFNTRTSARRQAWEDQRVAMLNDAEIRNLDSEQRVSNANVDQNNRFAFGERDRHDRLMQDRYARQVDERGFQNEMIGRTADWKKGERDRGDDLADRMYKYDFDKLAATTGVAYAQDNRAMQGAQDRNAAIQGLTNAGVSAYQYNDSNNRANAAEDRADRRAYFERHGKWEDEDKDDPLAGDAGSGNSRRYSNYA